jgi:Tfp pilus assembly PilM family ATPase
VFTARSKGWIGIDMGSRAIKLAQVERVGAHFRLAGARVIRRDPAASDKAPPGPALAWWSDVCHRETLREGFIGRRAACVLSASETDLRTVQVPEGAEAERRAMIASELDATHAGNGNARVFDFWETHGRGSAGQSNLESVSVLSVAHDEAVEVAKGLSRSGFYCEALDGLPLALARAVQMASAVPSETPVAALDWGSTSATFCIVRDGCAVFTRHLRDCGFAALPAAVAEALSLPVDDAEQLLATHGLSDPVRRDDTLADIQEILTDISSEPLGAVVAQLDKTLSYPELHRSGLVPESIWLFGGGATVRNVSAVLSERIGVPIQTWTLPQTGAGDPIGPSPLLPLLGPAIALSALAWMP